MPSGFMDSPVYYMQKVEDIEPRKRGEETYEFVVLEVSDELFGESLGALLESFHTVGVRLGELSLDGLHVALYTLNPNGQKENDDCQMEKNRMRAKLRAETNLEVGEEGLFVEGGGLETEGVDDVVDLGGALLEGLVLLLGGGVSA